MHTIIIRLLITLVCCLPAFAQATTSSSIHVEWGYTPPSTPAVTGFKLYQEGVSTCQTQDPNATAMDCQVTLSAATTNFTLTAIFSDATESPQSSPFAFSTTSSTSTSPAPVVGTSGSNLVTFSWEYPTTTGITGFRMYQNNILICQTADPTARQLACTVNINTTNIYALTAVVTDGTETAFSNTLAYTADTTGITTGSAVLNAVITTNALSGPAPLSINFSAASSTGTIASYQWDFGDGSSTTGNTISHIYTAAGSYTAKLTVTDAAGLSSTASTTVTAATATTTTPSVPPTAIISSSTAAGAAPLTVNFNGSGSTAAKGASIASYAWSFGDGSSATGASTTHTFTTAGTYGTILTVTDSNGLTSSANTPVVITAPVVIINKPPTAVASATPTSGTAPLAVSFDGSASTDTDGTIASYVWNFGDGSTATGKTATHTYTTAATFSATLQVTDNQGANNTRTIPITVKVPDLFAALNIELGEVTVSSTWVRVPLTLTYTNPIVVAGPPSFNNADPCVVRLRNVDKTGFDIRVAEWNYEDGSHPAETITYLVMEKGRIALPDGSSVEAGTFQGTTSFNTIKFSKSFAKVPVIMTTIASVNGTNTISGRNKNVGLASFAYSFKEQERSTGTHVPETVNFIAWQPGQGTIGSVQYEVATTSQSVTDAWYTKSFTKPFTQPPMLLANMQTTNDTDPSALRVQQVSATGFQVKVQEETSKSTNITHTAETVGYLVLDKVQ